MSTFTIVSRIIPTCAQGQDISNLMIAQDIGIPARTEWNCTGDQESGHFVVTQTTFCKEKIYPPNVDLDSTLAAECNAIPGLVSLEESKLPQTKESKDLKNAEKSLQEPIIKVAPYVLEDGTCGGILVTVPLKLSKEDLKGIPSTSNFNVSSVNLEENIVAESASEEKLVQKSSKIKNSTEFTKPVKMKKKIVKKNSSLKSTKNPNPKVWKCCGKEFTDALFYCYHRESHKCTTFYCDICFKEFAGKRGLLNHKRIH
ncbi:zinc finger and BTB domain-containing protein 47 [Caerostris extrusa]|uniref:Zinc finger and BTB domain-containing protein 47 n=1 Tax=Caerostris extrusa TaxID=172846 RepID=A0AAV4MMX7_CAEEX|nr:zinc finger and BTB domain-containing protein 47 [Caerostris extrusa]